MRIISSPVSASPLEPVRAPDAAGNRTHRDQAPTAKSAASVNSASARTIPATTGERPPVLGNPAAVGAGVTAQKVFHAVYGGRPEASLTEANRAYTKTDELRFRDTPFNLRVI